MEDKNSVNLWDILPEECKSMILSRLSNREAARIARVSKEFDQVVKHVRDAVQLLVLPPDLPPVAFQGLVASHTNLKCLSFKRCSGKVKEFLPILEAAAGGKLESKWNNRRSLESVDFRSCVYLTDVDVNSLCVLHSQLEDVNLANCQSISDVALAVLSRYQQSRAAPDNSTLDNSVTPSTESSEEPEEVAVSECQGPPDFQIACDDLWPGLSPEPKALTNISNESEIRNTTLSAGRCKTAQESQSPLPPLEENVVPETVGRASLKDMQSPLVASTTPARTYAQAALKALTSDSASPESYNNFPAKNVNFIGLTVENSAQSSYTSLTLPYRDWTSVVIPSAKPPRTMLSKGSCIVDKPLNASSPDATGNIAKIENQYEVMPDAVHTYKENSTMEKVDKQYRFAPLMDDLQRNSAWKNDSHRKSSRSPATAKELQSSGENKVLTDVEERGKIYYRFDVESSGDRRLATRRSLHIPNSLASTSEAEYNTLMKSLKATKAIRLRGATQITDQRLDMPGKKRTNKRVEACSSTRTDLDLFVLARGSPSKGRSEVFDMDESLRIDLLETWRQSEKGSQSSQGATPLQSRLEELQVGSMMRNSRHQHVSPDYLMESPAPSSKRMESWRSRGLRSVSVAGCSEVSDKGIQALLRGPSKESLVSLDISRCSGVTSAGLRLPPISALEILTAAQLPNITRLLLQLSTDGSLQHVSLAACPKLEDLHLVAPYLQSLNMSNCKKLTRLQLKCPELLSCNLSLCDTLENIGRFSCGALQNLNTYGCRMLTPAAFLTILDSVSGLQVLRCGGCDQIERIDIPQASLTHLDVSGCSSLRRLHAHSRVLKVVDACGCKNLLEVFLYSPNLRRMLFSNCALLQTLVIPLDAIKESVDAAVRNHSENPTAPLEGIEISVSGCNVSDFVRKNLSRLTKQWKATFTS